MRCYVSLSSIAPPVCRRQPHGAKRSKVLTHYASDGSTLSVTDKSYKLGTKSLLWKVGANDRVNITDEINMLSLAGDEMTANHYDKLVVKANACLKCGHCDVRCPFKVKQQDKMQKIAAYFGKANIKND